MTNVPPQWHHHRWPLKLIFVVCVPPFKNVSICADRSKYFNSYLNVKLLKIALVFFFFQRDFKQFGVCLCLDVFDFIF